MQEVDSFTKAVKINVVVRKYINCKERINVIVYKCNHIEKRCY